MNGITELYDSFSRGYLTLDDIRDTVRKETGILVDLTE